MISDILREPFIFVRHGRTDWSKNDITKGPADLSLNHLGAEEASLAAEKLASRSEDYVVVSSTLTRAIQTAQIIATKINTSVNIFPDLHERYFGDFREFTPLNNSEATLPPDAESESSFRDRVIRAISSTLNTEEFHKKRKIIVSHGLVFKQLSFILTGSERFANYGELFLFIPGEREESWTVEKI